MQGALHPGCNFLLYGKAEERRFILREANAIGREQLFCLRCLLCSLNSLKNGFCRHELRVPFLHCLGPWAPIPASFPVLRYAAPWGLVPEPAIEYWPSSRLRWLLEDQARLCEPHLSTPPKTQKHLGCSEEEHRASRVGTLLAGDSCSFRLVAWLGDHLVPGRDHGKRIDRSTLARLRRTVCHCSCEIDICSPCRVTT